MAKKQAFLISFEGIEGTGKSTQSRLLGNYLRAKGLKVAFFREPGTTVTGEKMRNILLHGKGKLNHFSETLLFIVARTQLVNEKIKPASEKKDIIILDRYIDATVAYQGYGSGVDVGLINKLNKNAVLDYVPDLTILFDLDPATGIKRSGRGDRFERRAITFHKKVRDGYLKVAWANKGRVKVVPVSGDIKTIQQKVREIVANECRLGSLKQYF